MQHEIKPNTEQMPPPSLFLLFMDRTQDTGQELQTPIDAMNDKVYVNIFHANRGNGDFIYIYIYRL